MHSKQRIFRIFFLLFLSLLTLAFLPAQSTYLSVTSSADSGSGSLRDAIQSAAPGAVVSISESLSGDTITLTSGPIQISGNVMIFGPEDAKIFISGADTIQIFNIQSTAVVTLRDLHLIHGNASGGTMGGAIYNAGNLNLQQVYFFDNRSRAVPAPPAGNQVAFGGALVNDGHLQAYRCVFRNNWLYESFGTLSGGAIANYSFASLRYCVFEKNTGLVGNYLFGGTVKGGAIYNEGRIEAYGCTFHQNMADGASQVQSGSGIGGAINNAGYFEAVATTFSENACGGEGLFGGSGLGGAIFSQDSLFLDQVTISGNVAEGGGRLGGATGAGIMTYGMAKITNSTITENRTFDASPAPAIAAGIELRGNMELGGTIIAHNYALSSGTPYPQGSDVNKGGGATVTSLGYNLIGENASLNLPNTQGNILNPSGFSLEPLADNGGPAQTHALPAGSPALDAGDSATTRLFDQRGFPRVVNGRADIGALEQGPNKMWVNHTQEDGAGSLRHALHYAPDHCELIVDPALSGQILFLLTGEITVKRKLKIAANQLLLRTPRNARLLKVQKGAQLELSGMSFFLGNVYEKSGGAIINHGELSLKDVSISNSFAFKGNAIFNTGDLKLKDCKLERNGISSLLFIPGRIGVGGAEGGAVYNAGTLEIKDCSIENNIAGLERLGGVAKGGAIFNAGTAALYSSTLSHNKAGGGYQFCRDNARRIWRRRV